jgi:hypothetical protein
MKWGDKYSDDDVIRLKTLVSNHLSYENNFICITDKPTEDWHIKFPTSLDQFYNPNKNFFWAYRKIYMMLDHHLPGDEFLFLDLDMEIHNSIDWLFKLDMKKPWIVKGYWNDPNVVKANFSKMCSTPINSSVIRWNSGQLSAISRHVHNNTETIFFTYPSLDNYLNHHWYDIWNEDKSFFNVFPEGKIYSWYKGNIWPNDVDKEKLRAYQSICLFNGGPVVSVYT